MPSSQDDSEQQHQRRVLGEHVPQQPGLYRGHPSVSVFFSCCFGWQLVCLISVSALSTVILDLHPHKSRSVEGRARCASTGLTGRTWIAPGLVLTSDPPVRREL